MTLYYSMYSILQVDGEEDINTGLDLYELAEVLVLMGAQQAVVSCLLAVTNRLHAGSLCSSLPRTLMEVVAVCPITKER